MIGTVLNIIASVLFRVFFYFFCLSSNGTLDTYRYIGIPRYQECFHFFNEMQIMCFGYFSKKTCNFINHLRYCNKNQIEPVYLNLLQSNMSYIAVHQHFIAILGIELLYPQNDRCFESKLARWRKSALFIGNDKRICVKTFILAVICLQNSRSAKTLPRLDVRGSLYK